jgi:hypothetical protein
MAVRAIAATGEQILNTETYVSSALGSNVQVYLPSINAGAGATVAVDTEIRIETTGAGAVELLSASGARVGIVPGRSQATVVARAGAAQSEADSWNFTLGAQTPAAFQSIGAAFAQAEIVALRDCLVNAGLMKAE